MLTLLPRAVLVTPPPVYLPSFERIEQLGRERMERLTSDVKDAEQATPLENGQPAGLKDAQAEAQVSAGGERFGCSLGEVFVSAPDEPSPERPVSKPKPVRKNPLPPGAAKMLHLLKEADRMEVATVAECMALQKRLQKALRAMKPHDRQTCLKELLEHHQVEYPTETEETYRAAVESATAFAAGREDLRVTVHAAAGGALGELLRGALPDATITQSDINPGQSPEVTDISEDGMPLLDGGEPAEAATYDFATARNCWYSAALSFLLLRAMLRLLKPGGRVCITCTRAQAPRAD